MCNNVRNYSLIFLSYADRNRNYTFITNVIRLFYVLPFLHSAVHMYCYESQTLYVHAYELPNNRQ